MANQETAMPMSRDEASEALQTVEGTTRRVTTLRSYEFGAPHFLLWGAIWIVGYGIAGWRPAWTGTTWLLLDVVGFGGSYWIGRRAVRRRCPGAHAYGARYAAAMATLAGLMLAILYVMRPRTDAQVAALPALLVATAYMLFGIFRGPRWAVAGAALALLTIGGFVLLPGHFMVWMAAAGGSTLMLSGLWLGRV
jgi:hypothetical protein